MAIASVLSSRTNARVKQLRAAFAGQARLSGGLVAIEGEHLLREALRSGIVFKTVFLSEHLDPPAWLPSGLEVLHLAGDVFRSVVETNTPQGLAALIVPPVWQIDDALQQRALLRQPALLLIACALQDPGNLGTLIRSAEAFGATGILTAPGTASAWNGKAVRASAGSVFRLPIVPATLAQVAALQQQGIRLLAAVGSDGEAAHGLDLAAPSAIMIGNEGSGIPAEWLALADTRVTIPCPGPVESLNAAIAGSLLLYEASRQRSRP